MSLTYRLVVAAVVFLGLSSPATSLGQSHDSAAAAGILDVHLHPFSELSYGIDWPRHEDLQATFPSVGTLEFKSGLIYVDTLKNGLLSVGDGFILGSYYSPDLGGGSGGTEGLTGKLGRFGLGFSQGYGYDLKGTVIVPYFGASGTWTQMATDRPSNLTASDIDILNRYEGTYRFGPSAESGVMASFGQKFSLSGGYEANVVYPRFVVWEALGSYLIVGAANGAVTLFGLHLMENSPAYGPILMFAVRTALAWGVYQLWRDEMNWPFHSETPLTHETLKFGLSYSL